MDVYEFTQALRRQRRLLIVGTILLLVATFFLTFKTTPEGLEPRVGPKYEASVRMLVTAGNVDSLADASAIGDAMAQTASFFQTLLMGPDATLAIAETTGAPIEEFDASAAGATITVRAVSDTPDGAVAIGLGAYDWLTARLDEPLDLVAVTPTTEAPSLLDAQGRMSVDVLIDLSPAFSVDGEGLWISLSHDDTQFKSISLVDAALEGAGAGAVPVRPGGELTIALEDVQRNQLDALSVPIPELIGPDNAPHTLRVRLDRGAIVGVAPATVDGNGVVEERDVSQAKLLPERVEASWELVETAEPTMIENPSIGLTLLTENPLPALTGARKGPILSMGALFGGLFALVVVALAVDGWRQEHRKRAMSAYNDRLAVVRPITGDERYEGRGPLSFRLKNAGGSAQAVEETPPASET